MYTVTLPQETWNNILLLLAEHPYKQAAPLIQGITNCLREQMQQQQPGENVTPMTASRPGA